jgi:hypothetical protein
MRFCSRCGLPISEVADWLAGMAGLAAPDEPRESVPSPRRRGMRRGAKIMFLGGVLLPVFIGLSIASDSPDPLVIPFIILLIGFAWLLYSRLFGEETPPVRIKQAQEIKPGATQGNNALPPASDAGIVSGGRRHARTAEMAQPPSVTDHTTKLLDKE